jgi:hypothetical protein
VAGLIAGTEKDLDQSIDQIGNPGLDAMRAWAAEEIRPIKEELATPANPTAALPPGLFAPRAVAVVASLGGIRLPDFASAKAAAPKKKAPKPKAPQQTAPKPAAPKQETITAEKSKRLLDQVGDVVSQILFLAENDKLEARLWVGSTPAQKVKFSFWPKGTVKGSEPAPTIIQTNGKRDHVFRGLYRYKAAWKKGAVTKFIEYPNPPGAPAAQTSERLDLVRGSGFFCCRFGEDYCQQVANEKECRP